MKSRQYTKIGIWNRYFLLLMLINFFSSLCNQFFNPTLTLRVNALGAPESVAGLLGTALTMSSAIFRVVGGKVADKRGRMRALFLGLVLFCGASSLFLFAKSIPFILVTRFLQGIGFGLASTSVTAAVADVLPHDSMASGIGYFGLGNSLSQCVGPSCAVALYYSHLGFPAVAAVATGSLALSALLTFTARYEKDEPFLAAVAATRPAAEEKKDSAPAEEYHGVWKYFEKSCVPCGIVMLFCCLASGVVIGFAVLYAKKENIALDNAGLFFTIAAVGVVISRFGTGKLMDRFGTRITLLISFCFGILCFTLLILARHAHFLYFAAGLFNGLSTGMYHPALNAESMFRAPASRRGAASATFSVPTELGFALSSVVAGIVIVHSNYVVCWLVCILYDVIGILLSFVFFRRKTPKKSV